MTVFTPNTPTVASTERQDTYDALAAILDAFIAAQPTILRKQHLTFPRTMAGEAPFIYLSINESILHDWQTRITVFSGWIGYVDTVADPDEAQDRVNAFADYMREWLTANPRIIPNKEFRQVGFEDGERLAGGVLATDPHVTFQLVSQVGRE